MSEYKKIGTLGDLRKHGQFSRWLGGHDVLVYDWKGQINAISNVCPHFGGPIGYHKLKDGKFVCLWHNFEFSADNGECVYGMKAKLRKYEVKLEDDEIFIKLNEGDHHG